MSSDSLRLACVQPPWHPIALTAGLLSSMGGVEQGWLNNLLHCSHHNWSWCRKSGPKKNREAAAWHLASAALESMDECRASSIWSAGRHKMLWLRVGSDKCCFVGVDGVQPSKLDNFFCIPESKLYHWHMEARHQGNMVVVLEVLRLPTLYSSNGDP